MEEAPIGSRTEADEPLFKTHTGDPAIVPDRIAPVIEGYFRIPAVWLGTHPEPALVLHYNPAVHHEIVVAQNMRCGIVAHAQRDGTFWFDFTNSSIARPVIIPGYRIPDPEKPCRPTKEHSRREQEAEAIAILRAQIMNVHQACLTTSESIVMRRSAAFGFPLTAWNTLKAIKVGSINYADDVEDIHALAHNTLNNTHLVPRTKPLPRRVIEQKVAEHSLEMLDHILSRNDLKLIQNIESIFIAACRIRDKRYGEAVTLAWGVCEQLVSQLWKQHLGESKARRDEEQRITKDRFKKLTGRDYTASVMVEMLELNRLIDHDLYRLLEVSRKARNAWAHEMRMPKQSECSVSLQAAQRLLILAKAVRLKLYPSGRGGVPQWPTWMWEQVKQSSGC